MRGVLHRCGDRAEMSHRAERTERVGRHQTECWFYSEDAAKCCRNANRPATIGAEVESAHAQCRRDCCPATGAP